MRKTIVCLANSYKHGGRCIAGIDIHNGQWIRLHGASPDGGLCACEYVLDDGSEPRLLDVIEVEVHYALPTDSHPEDWQIAPVRWHSISDSPTPAQWKSLIAAAGKNPTILRGYRDRMSTDEVKAKPMQSSLTLIQPDEMHWWIREERGKRKNRALFQRHHVTYDFAVTDPRWLAQLDLLPLGLYPHASFVDARCETWLTISLSEAYFGWHYKLVAGVIAYPGRESRTRG